jgi:Mor family transcriptional regulator
VEGLKVGRDGRQKPLQFVADLVDIGVRELTAASALDEPNARELMRNVAHAVCERYGRTVMYIPADLEFELSQRDQEIWRQYGEDSATAGKYTPARVAELAEQHKLTTVHIYNVIARMRKIEMKARCPELPGFEVAP